MSLTKPKLDDLRIERPDRAEPNARTWVGMAIVVGLVLLVGAAVWWWKRPKAIEVRTVVAREVSGGRADRTVLNASGYVTARREATVSSKVTGKVVEVLIEEGMKVQEGQVLARLDDTNVKAALNLAEAQLASANKGLEEIRVRIKEAEQELHRVADLINHKIATQADFDHAEAAGHFGIIEPRPQRLDLPTVGIHRLEELHIGGNRLAVEHDRIERRSTRGEEPLISHGFDQDRNDHCVSPRG